MASFRRRLVLVHLAVIVTVLGVAALSAYWGLWRSVHGQLDAALIALAETEIGMLMEHSSEPPRVHESAPGPAAPSFIRLDRLVQITDGQGEVLARSSNLGASRLPVTRPALARLTAGQTVFDTLDGYGEEPVRMVSVPVRVNDTMRVVQVAGSLDDVNNVVHAAGVLFIALGVALVLAVGSAGVLLTGRVFGAIDDVVRQARRIGEENLGERLPHPGSRDEIGRLVDTLNAMLDRIERAYEGQRRFTSDASHELRSPLSRLRTELEVTLRRPRDAGEYVQALRSCMEEAERLTVLVEDLLVLARLDAGQAHGVPETVSLNRIASEVIQRMNPIAHDRDVEVVLEPSPPVAATLSRGAAALVLANLLDNAVKFSPRGTRVTVRVGTQRGSAIISVTDQGPGIAAADMPHLFDRFYRGSAARAGETPGVGLGLALSQTVIQHQGGCIEAANMPDGGAMFSARVPLASAGAE